MKVSIFFYIDLPLIDVSGGLTKIYSKLPANYKVIIYVTCFIPDNGTLSIKIALTNYT